MSAKPIRLRLCDAIQDQFSGDTGPLCNVLGINETKFVNFLQGRSKLDDHSFDKAARWLFDYEGRVKPTTPYDEGRNPYANKVMDPSCEPRKVLASKESEYDVIIDGEQINFEYKTKSTEDLCQWIAQLEDQNKALKEELRLLKNKVGWAEEEVRDLREKFERIGSAFK